MIEEEAHEHIPTLLYKYWQYIIANDFDFGQFDRSADFFKPENIFLKTWGFRGTEKHAIPDKPEQRYVTWNLTPIFYSALDSSEDIDVEHLDLYVDTLNDFSWFVL